ncbi:MAG: phosphoglycerate mutase family protein [Bifidobacterium minimum]|jgi:probable phosphoglycerate mutase|nr:phosphoglycerate mutase family protein [Bifidobacterium minimum]
MRIVLHLVRHGQTYFNRYNRLQGWSNSPLTDQGESDARHAAEKLSGIDFAAAYCSDTTRAVTTARVILDANERAGHARPALTTSKAFREQFYGYFEGRDMSEAWWAAGAPHGSPTYAAIVRDHGLSATRDFLKQADPFHDAESDEEYWRRIESGFSLIASNPHLRDGDHVLQISHGNTLLSLINRFGPSDHAATERPANGSVTVIGFDTSVDLDAGVTILAYER